MRILITGLTTLAVLLSVPTSKASSAIDNSVHIPPSYDTLNPPANGASYSDPVYTTSIKRISNALATPNVDTGGMLSFIANEYSTASPFNLDNTRMILVHVSYFGLYDGNGKLLGNLPFEISASSEPRWSRQDTNTLYYHYANQLKSYNVASAAMKVVHTFSEYGAIKGNGEMEISYDGDHFVLVGDDHQVFLYTISKDSKGAVLETSGHGFDAVYVTPDNNVTVTWNQNGVNTRYSGIEMFDGNMNFQRQLAHAGGHMHMSRDINGDEVLVWTNSNDGKPLCGSNAIVKIHLADGVQTCLLSLDWSLAVHISAADSTWAFVETYTATDLLPTSGWAAYTDELLQIKLDGTEVRRLAHHRSRMLSGYQSQPKLTASHDGTRLAYSSNFSLQTLDGAPNGYADEYLIMVSATPAAAPVASTRVLNAASYQASLAPGAIVSIFGQGLAASAQSTDVTVTFNGFPATLFYVSPTQINALLPLGVSGDVALQVVRGSTIEVQQSVTVSAAAPGIFTQNGTGSGAGAILHATDYSPVSANAPASAGQLVSIYCTGLGALNGNVTAIQPGVTIGGSSASVVYSGVAPGYPGLYQVTVQVPAGVTAGNSQPLQLTSNGVASNAVTISLQ